MHIDKHINSIQQTVQTTRRRESISQMSFPFPSLVLWWRWLEGWAQLVSLTRVPICCLLGGLGFSEHGSCVSGESVWRPRIPRDQSRRCKVYFDLTYEFTHHYIHHILLVTREWLSPAEIQREGNSMPSLDRRMSDNSSHLLKLPCLLEYLNVFDVLKYIIDSSKNYS